MIIIAVTKRYSVVTLRLQRLASRKSLLVLVRDLITEIRNVRFLT